MIRQLQRQGPVFWNEALRGIQPEYCINMMYTPHSNQDGAKNVLKTLCFAGKKTNWLCERYKVLGNGAL